VNISLASDPSLSGYAVVRTFHDLDRCGRSIYTLRRAVQERVIRDSGNVRGIQLGAAYSAKDRNDQHQPSVGRQPPHRGTLSSAISAPTPNPRSDAGYDAHSQRASPNRGTLRRFAHNPRGYQELWLKQLRVLRNAAIPDLIVQMRTR